MFASSPRRSADGEQRDQLGDDRDHAERQRGRDQLAAREPVDEQLDVDELAHADAAMYCAKHRGRNNYQCFAPGMDHIVFLPHSNDKVVQRKFDLKATLDASGE